MTCGVCSIVLSEAIAAEPNKSLRKKTRITYIRIGENFEQEYVDLI
jgi:hypothetical protein